MTVRGALRSALGDIYRCSWRLLVLNTAVTAALSAVVIVVSAFPLVLFVAPLVAGPIAAAVVHCVLRLVREEEFELADAMDGLRRFWKQGFALGALSGLVLLLGDLAVSFYASAEHRVLPLAALSAYVVVIIFLILLVTWLLAIAEPEAGIKHALREAWLLSLRSPLRLITFGAVLLVVNVLGVVTVLPFLTLTIVFSFLATARLVLPAPTLEEMSA